MSEMTAQRARELVPCSRCNAKKDEPCRQPGGEMEGVHTERWQLAVKLSEWES